MSGAAESLRASLVGPTAAQALSVGACGSVRAVFERSFYVCLQAGWVCIGSARLGAGPLQLICECWPAAPALAALVRPGDAVRIAKYGLSAGSLRIFLDGAQPWLPEPAPAWSRASLGRGLAAVSDVLRTIVPADGLALLGRAAAGTPVCGAAALALSHVMEVLDAEAAGAWPLIDGEKLAPLVGLGPGLTPSGDDYLGGVLIALCLLGRVGLRDRLWQILEPLVAERTVDISGAHLVAAAGGFGCAALHRLLCAILVGATDRVVADAITALAAVGHSSGWDALAGALAVLKTSRSPGVRAASPAWLVA
jgi:hypothetical protein